MLPTIMYSLECWAIDRIKQQKMSVIAVRTIKQINGLTRDHKIRNEYDSVSKGEDPVIEKMQQNRMYWLGHILRIHEVKAVSIV